MISSSAILSTSNQVDIRNKKHILILGVGNTLQGDDGIGCRAIELLSQQNLPENVHIQNANLPGLELAIILKDWSRVIIIDAIRMGLPSGTWRKFKLDDISLVTSETALSLHQTDLASGILLANALGILPQEIIFYGIEPQRIEWGQGLSSGVEAALPPLLEEILADIRNMQE